MNIEVSENDLIAALVHDIGVDGVLSFISDLADYTSVYKFDFRDDVVKRMEADK